MKALAPGATIGVLGGGQLGRMLALAAHRMGYRVEIFAPEAQSPAGQVADRVTRGDYADEEALRRFARRVDAVTIEFENIPAAALELLDEQVPVRPGPEALFQTQNRSREKSFLARHGLPHAETAEAASSAQLDAALRRIGYPAVLKTAGFGYDGKGQLLLKGPEDAEAARAQLESGGSCVLERLVEFERELSVIVARSSTGATRAYRPFENRHRNHVLDVSLAPAQLSAKTAARALELAAAAAAALELVGVLAVEFFETPGGELLVNEMAPRPHNSGHLTIEACAVSQFEQQLRMVCGLPPGDPTLRTPAAMANLLGDLWQGTDPEWAGLLQHDGVALHLYGKGEARPGRKMGHVTALAANVEDALRRVEAARLALLPAGPHRGPAKSSTA